MSNTNPPVSFESVRQFRRFVFKNLERKTPRYHYPRCHLEQPYFTSPRTGKVTLRLGMLSNTTQFVSPLFALLNQLRSEGNDITGALDEAVALRTAAQQANRALEQIGMLTMEARLTPVETETSTGEQA